MTFDELAKTLNFIRPKAEWALRGNSLEDLEWLDKLQIKPTEQEIAAGFAQYDAWKAEQEAEQAAAKAAAEAKLAALGLTSDDLKALGL
jgi:hypothetical protein